MVPDFSKIDKFEIAHLQNQLIICFTKFVKHHIAIKLTMYIKCETLIRERIARALTAQ